MVYQKESALLDKEAFGLFIENLASQEMQLRFPAKTAFGGEYGVCVIVWNMIQDVVLMVPYKHKKSVFDKVKRKAISEAPQALARICLLAETGLDIDLQEPQEICPVFNSEDSRNEKKIFKKFTFLVSSFKGTLRSANEVLSEKNFEPVWVRRTLLKEFFETSIVGEDGRLYGHSQMYAYERFASYAEEILNVDRW